MMESSEQNISSASLTNAVKAQPSTTQPQAARKIILVIDDNLVFQKAMLMKLKARGYDVMTAEDGSAASAAMRRLMPDLILLDLNFPPDIANGGGIAWDGFLILRWLRGSREAMNVPVIAVTGGDLNLYRDQCKEAGILDLLAKPLDEELLVSKIRAALNQPEFETPPPTAAPKFQAVRRILLVDDDSPWRQMAVAALIRQGYEVVAAETAEKALSEAARIRPELMILDLKLEKEIPLAVMVLLLAAHPSVPLLVYAGMGLGQEAKSELMNLGVFQILQRRSMEELLAAVQLASDQPRESLEASEAKPERTPSEFDTVLIVEGDLAFSEHLRTFFESQSFYVTCVSNASEALRHMASTNFDVILTEMVLRGHSGEDFYNEVERLTPELCRRFIFMTGHEAERRTDNFIRRSRALMLWKPFPLDELLSAAQTVQRRNHLARLLARSRSLTAA